MILAEAGQNTETPAVKGRIKMKKVAFFDTKPYDKLYFDELKGRFDLEIKYYEYKLNSDTALLARGCDAVCAFVNDTLDAPVIRTLYELGIGVIAMRCAGYNNIDFQESYEKIHIVRVPEYSPYAVAEHTMAMILTLNRKTHRAYIRTRDFNFSLNSLMGFDLHGRTVGVVGTGKIGRAFIDICRGFGMRILAFDPYPMELDAVTYVDFDTLCRESDIISLHCPLTESTRHIVNADSLKKMKDGVYIINTSRGALIESEAILEAIKNRKVGAAALDVYEEETDLFFEDFSGEIIQDDVLSRLLSMPNVLVTSHQAFLTREALYNIALVTCENLKAYFGGAPLKNEVCYQCKQGKACPKDHKQRCF